MSSISSCLLSRITAFRNPNGTEAQWTHESFRVEADPVKVCTAELGYIAVVPFALIETALSLVAKVFALCLPLGSEKRAAINEWANSSRFSVLWSLWNVAHNFSCNDMIVSERVARACAATGNYFAVPREAL